ncbi:MAG: hypothetical protein KAS12_01225 [Candidatus Aenigmarchaeota archaeon]|nr:hypothetical protein [Candidatus Aenigmarchaeota archaeon]
MSDQEKMEALLRRYINATEEGEIQGSKEWKEKRKARDSKENTEFIVGGSEIASLMGVNHFKNKFSFIMEKINGSSFIGNIATMWGNLFEDVFANYVGVVYQTNVIPVRTINGIPHHKYSPDGLGVILMDCLVKYCDISVEVELPKICLFEFKCPLTRFPSGSPPVYYMPQIKAGLYTIKPAQIGLFGEGVFRKCSLNDYDDDIVYDETFHKQPTKKERACLKLYDKGIIGLYSKKVRSKIIDLGDASFGTLFGFLKSFDNHNLTAYIAPGNTGEEKLQAINIFARENNVHFSAILPWKLLHVNMTWITKENDYLDEWIKPLADLAQLVNAAKKSDHPEEMVQEWLQSGEIIDTDQEYEDFLAYVS